MQQKYCSYSAKHVERHGAVERHDVVIRQRLKHLNDDKNVRGPNLASFCGKRREKQFGDN